MGPSSNVSDSVPSGAACAREMTGQNIVDDGQKMP